MDKTKSREDYLEAILQLSKKGVAPKSIEVAKQLSFSKPSVSIAMKKLLDDELIYFDDDNRIHLTEKGKQIAEKTLEKHEYLKSFFMNAGIDAKRAEDIACDIEHSIDEESFNKLKNYLKK